jgi:hypothetical protein
MMPPFGAAWLVAPRKRGARTSQRKKPRGDDSGNETMVLIDRLVTEKPQIGLQAG